MAIRNAIYSILSADAGVTALTTSISHGVMNQETLMLYITFLIYDQDPNETKDTLSELDVIYVSVSCISQDNINAVNIAEAVRTALDGYSGTVDGTVIQSTAFLKLRDSWLQDAKGYQMVVEFQLFMER